MDQAELCEIQTWTQEPAPIPEAIHGKLSGEIISTRAKKLLKVGLHIVNPYMRVIFTNHFLQNIFKSLPSSSIHDIEKPESKNTVSASKALVSQGRTQIKNTSTHISAESAIILKDLDSGSKRGRGEAFQVSGEEITCEVPGKASSKATGTKTKGDQALHKDGWKLILAKIRAYKLCVNFSFTKRQTRRNEYEAKERQWLTEKEELDATIISLKVELEAQNIAIKRLERELGKAKASHEINLKYREPLLQVGIATRRRFLESTKRYRINPGDYIGVHGARAVPRLIEQGNDAAHRGNFLADTALFELGLLKLKASEDHFQKIYGVAPKNYDRKFLIPKVTEIVNMRGTMASCYSWTFYTVDGSDDRRFEELEKICWKILDAIRDECKSLEEGIVAFDTNPQVQKAYKELRVITEGIVKEHKRQNY